MKGFPLQLRTPHTHTLPKREEAPSLTHTHNFNLIPCCSLSVSHGRDEHFSCHFSFMLTQCRHYSKTWTLWPSSFCSRSTLLLLEPWGNPMIFKTGHYRQNCFSCTAHFWDFGLFCFHNLSSFNIFSIHIALPAPDFNHNTYLRRLFSQDEFVSSLQQHVHTPNFTVLFLFIF